MSDVLRVGIVGCGMIAKKNHLPGFAKAGGWKVTALCDVRPERMAEKAEEFGLAEVARFEKDTDLFASGLVDAVAICTPNDCHYPQTLAACAAGLHVLCEKPMAGSLDQCTRMIEAAKKAGVVLQINQSIRYNAAYQTIVRKVREGAIGDPFHVRCIRAGNGTPNKGWSPGADWFVQKKHEGGMLVDIGIHMADLLRMIMGPATKVAGLVDTRLPDIDVPDNISALYRYANGGTGVLELSWTLPGGAGFLEVYGTKGRIRMGFAGKDIQLWQDGPEGGESVLVPEPCPSSQVVFARAIRGEEPSWTPGEYGRRALALCLGALESSETGKWIDLPAFPGENLC